jgi:8-oxo-dGTP diphosphatase
MPIQRRFRTILTARLILEYRDHTLYLAQTKNNGNGFTLPGGKIEGEEFAKAALVREAKEEVGIILSEKSLKLVHIIHKRLHSTTEIIFFFQTTKWFGELEVKELDRFKDAVWYPNDEPPKRLPAVLKFAMEKINKKKIFSQFPSSKVKKKDKLPIEKIENLIEKPKAKVKTKAKPKAKLKEKVKAKAKPKVIKESILEKIGENIYEI